MTKLEKMEEWKNDVRDEIIDALALDHFSDVDDWLSIYKTLTFRIRQYVKVG